MNYSWPKFKGDLYNSGQSPINVKVNTNSAKRWVFNTRGLVWSSPIVDEKDNVYVGSSDGFFYAIDDRGKLIWKYQLMPGPDSIIDSAATFVDDNLLVIPGGDGYLHCVDKLTGNLQWQFQAKATGKTDFIDRTLVNSFEGNVLYNKQLGLIYAPSDDGCLYAVDIDGREVWHFATGMMAWALPAFDQDNQWLAFGSLDNYLYFLHPKTGDLLEKIKLDGEIKATPCYDPQTGDIWVATSAGSLYCAKVDVGYWKEKWRLDLGDELYSSPSYMDGKVVIGTMNGLVECYSFDGDKLWSYYARSPIASSPIISADGVVLIGDKSGKLMALDLQKGSLLWQESVGDGALPANLDSSPALTNSGTVVVGSYNGNIYSLPIKISSKVRDVNFVDSKNENFLDVDLVDDNSFSGAHRQVGSLFSPIKIQINDREHGDLSRYVFSNNYKIDIFPKLPVETSRSSDGRYIFVVPKENWRPQTDYKIKITSDVSDRGFSLIKLFKDSSKKHLSKEMSFTSPKIGTGKDWEYFDSGKLLLHSFFLRSHRDLETYVAAAFFNQKFYMNIDKSGSNDDIKAIMQSAEGQSSDNYNLAGGRLGDSYFMRGSFKIAVMGTTVPVSDVYLSGVVRSDRLDGSLNDFLFSIPVLGIKENNNSFKFPPKVFSKVVNKRMNIVGLAKYMTNFVQSS